MFFSFFFAFSAASRQFCLCQPDRPGNVCSLQKKCHKFNSDSEIIIYEKFNFSRNWKFITEDKELEKIGLKVFGSTPASPIVLDISIFDGKKVSFFGGEFNQMVKLVNLNPDKPPKFSLSAKNIQLFYDDSQIVQFDKKTDLTFEDLNLHNSILKGSRKLRIIANKVFGDSKSLSSQFYEMIKCGQITSNNNDKITAPYNIISSLLSLPEEESKNEKFNDNLNAYLSPNQNFQTLEIDLLNGAGSDIPDSKMTKSNKAVENESRYYSRIYKYCLSTTARLSRAISQLECESFSVPEANYTDGKSSDFLVNISQTPSNSTIKLYLTASTESDPIKINLRKFQNNNITLEILKADSDIIAAFQLKGNQEEQQISLKATNINYLTIDAEYLTKFSNISLSASPLKLINAISSTHLKRVYTDSMSIASFEGNISIIESITLDRTTPMKLNRTVFLFPNATLYVKQYRNFPRARLGHSSGDNYYFWVLSDANEDSKMNFYYNDTINLYFTDEAINEIPPSLTFSTTKDFYSNSAATKLRDQHPFVNVTVIVPETGLALTFGTGNGEMALPRTTSFLVSPIEKNLAIEINLTINDFESIRNNVTEMYFLIFYKEFSINVMTSGTLVPYLNGVNEKYNITNGKCNGIIPFPKFISENKCYQIGGYNLSRVTLDVQSYLNSLYFSSNTVNIGTGNISTKLPPIASELRVASNSTENINISINESGNVSETTPFTLALSSSPVILFDDSFKTVPKNITSKLTILHGGIDLQLNANGIPIPIVKLDDPVLGVSYNTSAKFTDTPIDENFFEKSNTRYGPVVRATVKAGITIPQSAFLAKNVILRGESENAQVTFVYWNLSVCSYEFDQMKIKFINVIDAPKFDNVLLADNKDEENDINNTIPDKTVYFRAHKLSFANKAFIQQDTAKNNLTMEVESLVIASPESIPNSSFIEPINVTSNFTFEGYANQIFFGNDTIRLVGEKTTSVAIKQNSNDVPINIKVTNSGTKKLTLSVEGNPETVLSRCNVTFSGQKPYVYVDKSWFQVKIPTNFVLLLTKETQIETEMIKLPPFNIIGGEYKLLNHEAKYTNELAFFIFVGIIGAIFLISIILCIIGLTCLSKEKFDVSSDVETKKHKKNHHKKHDHKHKKHHKKDHKKHKKEHKKHKNDDKKHKNDNKKHKNDHKKPNDKKQEEKHGKNTEEKPIEPIKNKQDEYSSSSTYASDVQDRTPKVSKQENISTKENKRKDAPKPVPASAKHKKEESESSSSASSSSTASSSSSSSNRTKKLDNKEAIPPVVVPPPVEHKKEEESLSSSSSSSSSSKPEEEEKKEVKPVPTPTKHKEEESESSSSASSSSTASSSSSSSNRTKKLDNKEAIPPVVVPPPVEHKKEEESLSSSSSSSSSSKPKEEEKKEVKPVPTPTKHKEEESESSSSTVSSSTESSKSEEVKNANVSVLVEEEKEENSESTSQAEPSSKDEEEAQIENSSEPSSSEETNSTTETDKENTDKEEESESSSESSSSTESSTTETSSTS